MNERDIQNTVRLAIGADAVMFRNNTGMAWVGQPVRQGRNVLLLEARPFHAGLCAGSSDLVGWRTVEVTPDMVGQKVAVFCAVEVKSLVGKVTFEQRNFIDQVVKAGGYAGVARTAQEARSILRLPSKPFAGKTVGRRTVNVKADAADDGVGAGAAPQRPVGD